MHAFVSSLCSTADCVWCLFSLEGLSYHVHMCSCQLLRKRATHPLFSGLQSSALLCGNDCLAALFSTADSDSDAQSYRHMYSTTQETGFTWQCSQSTSTSIGMNVTAMKADKRKYLWNSHRAHLGKNSPRSIYTSTHFLACSSG